MKKAISMMLATAMAATCLAGCGSAASSSAAASSEAASSEATSAATSEASTGEKTFENNELNIAVFEGGYGSAYWDEIIKRFEDAYPGVTVNMQISPKIGDIIRPQIVAGNVPDFISMNDNDSTGLISSMVKEHALMDLSDVFEEGGIDDDTPLKDQVIDGLLDSAKCSPYGDGKIYIAPFDASPMGLVYNKTLFEENGWETPVTWDDFFELGDKAKGKGIALFTYQGIYPGYLESMLWPALASATGIDNMKAIASYTPGSLSSDEALKVFQNMAKIGTDGYLMDGTVALNHTQSQTDMMMNKALFIPNGNWMEGEMADAPRADGFEFGLTCAPVLDDGEARYVMSSVEQFEIPANAKNPELAKEFLRFLYTEDDLALLHYLFHTLVQIEYQLGNPRGYWHAIEAKLVPLSVDAETGLMLSPNEILQETHRHFSHAMAIEPLCMLRYENPQDRSVIDATVDHLVHLGSGQWVGFSFGWMALLQIARSNGNGALYELHRFAEHFLSRNGFHLNGDYKNSGVCDFHYRPFTLEADFLAAHAVQKMLLRSEKNHIEVLPACPQGWKNEPVAFQNLRAENGLLISYQRTADGKHSLTVKATQDGSWYLCNTHCWVTLQAGQTQSYQWTEENKK